MNYKKKIIIFCGPSGVGKGTIESILFNRQDLRLKLSCSATSREPRDKEIHGTHYYFMSKRKFERIIKENGFLEWSAHFNNYYGTLYSQIEKIIDEKRIPFLEIETHGARQIIDKMKITKEYELITIFLEAPDMQELERRIRGRATESNDVIEQRLKKAKEEIKESAIFEYRVVNITPEQAANEIAEIIKNHDKKHGVE